MLVSTPRFSRLLNTLEQLNIIEYIISSTDSLNELVNSNDNHVHTIIVELREPLGLS